MEQGRYWMWAKAKPVPDLLTPSAAMNSFGDSWEEQAFAEDAAGSLGGCVWPPRSYSCSFCRREFRSAQALGGHMNVHRRDRARLKQSLNSPPEVVPQNNHALNTCTSFDSCTFLYSNPNPNLDRFSDTGTLVPVSPLIRVSSPRSNTDHQEKNSTGLSFFPPLVGRDSDAVSPQPPSWSSFLSEKRGRPVEKGLEGVEPESRVEKEDCVTEDLSKSLNFAQNSDEEVASCKRRRIEAKVPLISLPKLSLIERCVAQSDVSKLSAAGSAEELDLELRLGNAPKVK